MFKTLAVLLILLALTAFPIGMVVFGVRQGVEVQDRKTWPSTDGRVLASKIVQRTNDSIGLRVHYRYDVEGIAYEGTGDVSRASAKYEVPQDMQDGAAIRVLYDEDAPGRSALDVGSHALTIFLIAFGAIGTLFLLPVVAYFGLILFAEILMVKARYHLKKGMKAVREGVAAANRAYEDEGEISDALAERGTEVIAQSEAAQAMFRAMQRAIGGDSERRASEPAEPKRASEEPTGA